MAIASRTECTNWQALGRSVEIVNRAQAKLTELFGDDPRISEFHMLEELSTVSRYLDRIRAGHVNDDFGNAVVQWRDPSSYQSESS